MQDCGDISKKQNHMACEREKEEKVANNDEKIWERRLDNFMGYFHIFYFSDN